MNKSLRSCALLAILACSAVAASAAVTFGSTTNTTDVTASFANIATGDDDFSFNLAAGNYIVNSSAVMQMSTGGKIDNVKFNGQPYTKEAGGAYFDLVNYAFSVPTGGETLDFVIKTSQTVEHYFVPAGFDKHGKVIEMERTRHVDPTYFEYMTITDVGTPAPHGPTDIPAVPEPASMALMLSGLLGVGFMAARRKAIKA